MSANDPRVPPIEPGTNPEFAEIEHAILSARGRISLLYRVLLNGATVAQGWERMLTAIRNQTSLEGSLRELLILRVAVLNRAPFEFAAHVPYAERAGVPPAKIQPRQPLHDDGFTAEERLALELAAAMTQDVRVPEALFARLRERYSHCELVELVATIAAYNMVSRFLVAMNIVEEH